MVKHTHVTAVLKESATNNHYEQC